MHAIALPFHSSLAPHLGQGGGIGSPVILTLHYSHLRKNQAFGNFTGPGLAYELYPPGLNEESFQAVAQTSKIA
jgi:hypothetical protein